MKDRHSLETQRLVVSSASLFDLVLVTSFNFVYGLIVGTMGLVVLPAEARRMYPEMESLVLGLSLGLVGVSQLVCPLVGRVSDMHVSRTQCGRRFPYILPASVFGIFSVAAMWTSSAYYSGWGYYTGLFVGMLNLNTIYSVSSGLIPDLLRSAMQQKRASAVVAIHSVLGSACGFLMVISTNSVDFHAIYAVYCALLVLSNTTMVVVAVRIEKRDSSHRAPLALRNFLFPLPHLDEEETPLMTPRTVDSRRTHILTYPILSCSEALSSFAIDTSNGLDFLWVFVGRTMYYIAVSVQAFMMFFLRDVVVGNEALTDLGSQVAVIALVAQAVGASLAYPASMLSKRTGMKLIVYGSCTLMALVYAGFICAPLAKSFGFYYILLWSVVYGAGNGAFLSVDYALAMQTLPDKDAPAQALGIWGVSAFIGSSFGPLIWGMMVQWIGSPIDGSEHYRYRGYLSMLVCGIVACGAAGGFIGFVKGVK
ncbi:MAG: hypothetical protein KVP17_004392 [Porospora cf. gigantea B]|uniref:uncharacterized protein n=1 Tax=Porospora cf. gigantea B TaxID=2853592 RepID=UPI003571BC40|nr:MAG: hypothetical protein KVP17_004392 [Porospora cf. gigantea B]